MLFAAPLPTSGWLILKETLRLATCSTKIKSMDKEYFNLLEKINLPRHIKGSGEMCLISVF